MTVLDRISDADFLAANGRWEGALLMTLVAVAGASRIQFPQGTPSVRNPGSPMRDREAFIEYLRDNSMRVTGSRIASNFLRATVAGESLAFDELLYRYYRCALVHEAGLDSAVTIVSVPPHPNAWTLRFGHDQATGKWSFSTDVLKWLSRIVVQDCGRRIASAV